MELLYSSQRAFHWNFRSQWPMAATAYVTHHTAERSPWILWDSVRSVEFWMYQMILWLHFSSATFQVRKQNCISVCTVSNFHPALFKLPWAGEWGDLGGGIKGISRRWRQIAASSFLPGPWAVGAVLWWMRGWACPGYVRWDPETNPAPSPLCPLSLSP